MYNCTSRLNYDSLMHWSGGGAGIGVKLIVIR